MGGYDVDDDDDDDNDDDDGGDTDITKAWGVADFHA